MSVKVSELIKTYEDGKSGDFSVWVDKLELVAKLQKVDDLTTFLPLFLSGAAFAVYKHLEDDIKEDYPKLKAALLTAFSVDRFSAYIQLQNRALKDGEAVDVYLADLKRLTTLMGQSEPDPLLKCAFMAGLPTEVATQLKSIASVEDMGLSELVNRARMMITAGNGEMTSCAAGKRRQHWQRREVRCYRCNKLGHIQKNCFQMQGNASGEVYAPALPPM